MKKTLLLILLSVVACQKTLPEEALLKMFQQELDTIDRYQGDYVAYTSYQVSIFEEKQDQTNAQIKSINKKFSQMSDLEKNRYQKDWQKKFQPVVDEIYQKTQPMLASVQQNLTPVQEAKIQELMVQLEYQQKKSTDVKLLPQFYNEP